MADPAAPEVSAHGGDAVDSREYQVVARRYRPQGFAELVGQEHVAQALSNAINQHRVGHAYLFTGARGVGKTSAARIFAKALNCQQGTSPTPCNACDACQSIALGEDVDVLEIDGASNRGIEEMRELRHHVHVRPSRSRFKIYIIDEVHMLTREAFNALLKTLEEPPEHVKFIFCTTEAEKIPITILSRCQRFDFAGIQPPSIAARLRQIAAAERVEIEEAALDVLARRAGGSMRDSQSLLEQLMSFGGERIVAADVHRLLGAAGDQRLGGLVRRLATRDAVGALAEFDAAVREGVDVGQLLTQLLGYFRDLMVIAAGGTAELLRFTGPGEQAAIGELARGLGLETILAAMQVLDQALARMRTSTQGRTLAELAVVRVCRLPDLESLADLVAQVRQGASLPARPAAASRPALSPPAPTSGATGAVEPAASVEPAKKNDPEPVGAAADGIKPPTSGGFQGLTAENAPLVWRRVIEDLTGMLAENASRALSVASSAPNRLVVQFSSQYNLCRRACEQPDSLTRLTQAASAAAGGSVQISFVEVEAPKDLQSEPPGPPSSPRQRLAEVATHQLVKRAAELFGAEPVMVSDADSGARK